MCTSTKSANLNIAKSTFDFANNSAVKAVAQDAVKHLENLNFVVSVGKKRGFMGKQKALFYAVAIT